VLQITCHKFWGKMPSKLYLTKCQLQEKIPVHDSNRTVFVKWWYFPLRDASEMLEGNAPVLYFSRLLHMHYVACPSMQLSLLDRWRTFGWEGVFVSIGTGYKFPIELYAKGNSDRISTAQSVPYILTVRAIPPQNNDWNVPSGLVHSSNDGKLQVVAFWPLGAIGTLELFPSDDNSNRLFSKVFNNNAHKMGSRLASSLDRNTSVTIMYHIPIEGTHNATVCWYGTRYHFPIWRVIGKGFITLTHTFRRMVGGRRGCKISLHVIWHCIPTGNAAKDAIYELWRHHASQPSQYGV
jgi:hypothetical protein